MLWTGQNGEVQNWNLRLTGSKKSGGAVYAGLMSPANYWTARGFNDIDQDGVADILWLGAGGEVACWLLNADGTLKASRYVVTGKMSPASYWSVAGFADIDRDGTADLLWLGAGGEVAYWLLNPDGTRKASGYVFSGQMSPPSYWQARGFADINRDGTADILWLGAGGEVAYWLLNPDGTRKSTGYVFSGRMSPANYWSVAGFADIDRDGTADILWTGAGGEVAYWLLNADGTRKSSGYVTSSRLSPPTYWTVCGFRDLDGDGTADILWYGSGGETRYWLLDFNGAYRLGGQICAGSASPSYWSIRGVGSSGR